MKNGCFAFAFALALVLPICASAAPAVYGRVTVTDNKSAVAAVVAAKTITGNGDAGANGLPADQLPCQGKVCSAFKRDQFLTKGALFDLRNVSTPDASLNVNSIKLRGDMKVGNLNVINNDADLLLSIGGQANVNSIAIGGR